MDEAIPNRAPESVNKGKLKAHFLSAQLPRAVKTRIAPII